jgi:sugar/nucleoside kinase (ribokinase family)
VALTLSDTFVVEGHRAELLSFLGDVDILFANEAELCALFECGFDGRDRAAAHAGARGGDHAQREGLGRRHGRARSPSRPSPSST